jgi:hypothetical protein
MDTPALAWGACGAAASADGASNTWEVVPKPERKKPPEKNVAMMMGRQRARSVDAILRALHLCIPGCDDRCIPLFLPFLWCLH